MSKFHILFGWLLLQTFDLSAQLQIGNDVQGDGAVCMPDARTVAVGGYYPDSNGAGYVKIYELKNNHWTQKGTEIVGEAADDYALNAIDMPDANTIAIGAENNDGNGSASGHVRVYSWDGTSWIQKGGDIDGEEEWDHSGNSVSMPDANTIAIGAENNDGNGSASGHVRVYSWYGTSWIQKGIDIDGEVAGDGSGASVSMPNAVTVAIGAPNNDKDEIESQSNGHARVFIWTGTLWQQKGEDINGESAWDLFGESVSMPDENTIAVGGPNNDGANDSGNQSGHVRVYSWDGTSWIQPGGDIQGAAYLEFLGNWVCMPDSNTVAVNPGRVYSL